MILLEVSSVVDMPADDVFDFLADATNNPKWQRGMRSCAWTTESPIRVGSRYDQMARFLGKEIITHFEVVELEPPRRVVIRSQEGSSFPLTVARTVEPLDDGRCRATETVEGDPRGFYRVATPLLRAMVRRSMHADHRRLGQVLERGREDDPPCRRRRCIARASGRR